MEIDPSYSLPISQSFLTQTHHVGFLVHILNTVLWQAPTPLNPKLQRRDLVKERFPFCCCKDSRCASFKFDGSSPLLVFYVLLLYLRSLLVEVVVHSILWIFGSSSVRNFFVVYQLKKKSSVFRLYTEVYTIKQCCFLC